MKRKAQITLFIIIGLLLVLGVIVFVTLFYNEVIFRPPEEIVLTDIPTELKPLAFMIEQCQAKVVEEGAKQLLLGGGYFDYVDAGIVSIAPGIGTGVQLGENDVLPYWFYIDGTGPNTKKPALIGTEQLAMNVQLSDYVNENLEDCVSFDSFPQYDISRGEPSSVVEIADEEVLVTTFWNMRVNTGEGVAELTGFQSRVYAPVGHLYRTAEELVEIWSKTRGPEQLTMDWLVVYADGNYDLPPLYEGLDISYSFKTWPLTAAEDDLEDVLTMMTNSMGVLGSNNFNVLFSDEPAVQELYIASMTDVSRNVERTNAHFNYPFTGFNFRVNDNPAVAIPSVFRTDGSLMFLTPPVVDNSFYYDLTYPLLITLEQDGYTLRFAYEVNIENNEPTNIEIAEEDEEIIDYCSHSEGTQLFLTANRNIDAPVTYTCGSISCVVGALDDGTLSTTLPTCAYGILEASAEGWFSEQIYLDSAEDGSATEYMEFHRPTKVYFELWQRNVRSYLDGEENRIYELESRAERTPLVANEKVLFVRQGQPYVASPDEEGYMFLVPGTYDVFVTGMVELNPPLIIPEETRDYGGGVAGIGSTTVTIPEVEIDTIPGVYVELTGTNAVNIPEVPTEIRIIAAGLDPSNNYRNNFEQVEDLEYIGELFDLATTIQAEEAIRLIG